MIVFLFLACSYKSQTQAVAVLAGAAAQVNFTLVFGGIHYWSRQKDFDIKENLQESYLGKDTINGVMGDVAETFKDIAVYKYLGDSTERSQIVSLEMTSVSPDSRPRPRVALIGGLNGDEPLGAEMIIRLARHISTGEYLSLLKSLPNTDPLSISKHVNTSFYVPTRTQQRFYYELNCPKSFFFLNFLNFFFFLNCPKSW